MSQAVEIVESFIAAINSRDVSVLADLMSEDHTFIDSLGNVQSGRDSMIAGWESYFRMFPDYAVEVDTIIQQDSVVAVFGSTMATYNGKRGLVAENKVGGPAAWKAIVDNGKVKSWQVYADWTEDLKVINADKESG